jgi:hypothetical protein
LTRIPLPVTKIFNFFHLNPNETNRIPFRKRTRLRPIPPPLGGQTRWSARVTLDTLLGAAEKSSEKSSRAPAGGA